MDKKITRRAVLGTIVGGLAIGPFVIRALRRDRIVDLDEAPPLLTAEDLPAPPPMPSVRPRFVNEWRAYHQRFLSPEVVQDDQNGVSLKPDLSAERKWEFINVRTHIQGVHSSIEGYTADTGEAMYYEVVEGVAETGSGKLVASVTRNELRRVVGKENLSSKCIIEIGKDGNVSVTHEMPYCDEVKVQTRALGRFEFTDRAERFSTAENFFAPTTPFLRPVFSSILPDPDDFEGSMLHSLIWSAMAFPYIDSVYIPNRQVVVPASTVVESGHWGIPQVLDVGRFKKIGKRSVVPVSGELALDSEQLRSYYQELIRAYVSQSMPNNWDAFDEAARERLEDSWRQVENRMLAQVDPRIEWEKWLFEKTTWHVDVESGLVLQREHCRRPPFGVTGAFTTFDHFQMVES